MVNNLRDVTTEGRHLTCALLRGDGCAIHLLEAVFGAASPDVYRRHGPGESIVSAAVRELATGDVYLGTCHADALVCSGRCSRLDFSSGDFEDGFYTSRGRFVDRAEAVRVARDARQAPDLGLVPGAKEMFV